MFNSKETHEVVLNKIEKLGLPVPPKPTNEDIKLPEDPSKMSSTELAQKLMRAASWYAYAQRLYGILESELVLVEAEFKIKVNAASIPIRKELGRQNADVIEAAVLSGNENLTPLYERLSELNSIRKLLSSRLEIYDRTYASLSREQSRRESEMRVQ